ncbi:amidohydrolase [Candidatus Uabimicrobium sp. HlEnr_7]|uniref:amidohydrolase n=1 Tax=Candidatus Uabimicrobium helgolandensis TaxID=3095367 RepID=UPI003558C5E6
MSTRQNMMILLILFTAIHAQQKATLVLINSKIVTMNSKQESAQALAIFQDKIIAIGSDEEIKSYIDKETQVIDLKGKLVVPGFIECHAHLLNIGRARQHLNLARARNWDEVVKIVKNAVAKSQPGQWIRGRGWHQEKWDSIPSPNKNGFPVHDSLSAISPNNPVYLRHASGHAAIVNAKAMKLTNINRRTPNPYGGEIVRDALGHPTGLLRETAEFVIHRLYTYSQLRLSKEQNDKKMLQQIELGIEECISKGITSFQDAGVSLDYIDTLKQLANENKLKLRMWLMIGASNKTLDKILGKYRTVGWGNNFVTMRAIKSNIDGALGSHGAWLLESYTDKAQHSGLNTTPAFYLKETAKIAAKYNVQLCIHAIGDRANREVLNIFEETFKKHPKKKDWRWRIEHAQHLHPQDIPRFAQLGVIASIQGVHCTSDGSWVPTRLGQKRSEEGAYVWRKLIDSGAVLCNGTDAPVEDVSPIANFYSSISRKLKNGKTFFPKQCMTRKEALATYTINAAYAAFEEKIKGSLEVGKLADIAILSQDILTIPQDDVPATKVLYTIVGGKIVYKR